MVDLFITLGDELNGLSPTTLARLLARPDACAPCGSLAPSQQADRACPS